MVFLLSSSHPSIDFLAGALNQVNHGDWATVFLQTQVGTDQNVRFIYYAATQSCAVLDSLWS
jgi:hypothetical protein